MAFSLQVRMIDRKWQRKNDYLTSKFLSLGLICSKDFINGAPDLVIPLSSVETFLGENPPSPVCSSPTGVCAYTEKDDVITIEDFKNCISRNHDSHIYPFYTVNMERFYSSCDTRNSIVELELVKLKYLCVPDITALIAYIEKACPLVSPSFKDMLDRESCIFELLELRKGLAWKPF